MGAPAVLSVASAAAAASLPVRPLRAKLPPTPVSMRNGDTLRRIRALRSETSGAAATLASSAATTHGPTWPPAKRFLWHARRTAPRAPPAGLVHARASRLASGTGPACLRPPDTAGVGGDARTMGAVACAVRPRLQRLGHDSVGGQGIRLIPSPPRGKARPLARGTGI